MPISVNPEDMKKLDEVVATRRRVKQGERLFSNGDPFTSLYAIRTGFFKTCISSEDGREQVTGFQMAGEIIGLDGIVSDHHSCNAVALEDADVCVMPFANVEELSREFPVLQRHVHKIMSREIVRENSIMMLLGNMRAEERIAAFLLNLVQRLHALCDGILDASILLVYEGRWRPKEKHEARWIEHQAGKVSRALAFLEAAPPPFQPMLHVGHIGLACALGYQDFRFEGRWRAAYPNLVGWLDEFAWKVPSFAETKPQ